jgi:hypothetical protein
MSDIQSILKQSAVFGGLDNSDIEQLETLFDQREVSPGDILASKGASYEY